MDYHLKTIPHKSQRYPTCGDYWMTANGLELRVSDMGDLTQELAAAIHELIEQHLCKLAGIKIADIDSFDKNYETSREDKIPLPCGCKIQEEPGNDIHAPYHLQHVFATVLEKQFIGEAAWAAYDKKINDL